MNEFEEFLKENGLTKAQVAYWHSNTKFLTDKDLRVFFEQVEAKHKVQVEQREKVIVAQREIVEKYLKQEIVLQELLREIDVKIKGLRKDIEILKVESKKPRIDYALGKDIGKFIEKEREINFLQSLKEKFGGVMCNEKICFNKK